MKKKSLYETAQNYAKAWFEACESAKNAERAFQDAQKLSRALNADDLRLLSNPTFDARVLNETLAEISQKLKLQEESLHFLQLMGQNRRLHLLPLALQAFTHIYYQAQNILEVSVQSAQMLSASQKKTLESGLEKGLKRQIVVSYKLNPSVLGGLSVQYGDVLWDDTLKNKLNRLEQAMKGHE